MGLYDNAQRYGYTSLPSRLTYCSTCGKKLMSGVVKLSRSYIVDIQCDDCAVVVPTSKAISRSLKLPFKN